MARCFEHFIVFCRPTGFLAEAGITCRRSAGRFQNRGISDKKSSVASEMVTSIYVPCCALTSILFLNGNLCPTFNKWLKCLARLLLLLMLRFESCLWFCVFFDLAAAVQKGPRPNAKSVTEASTKAATNASERCAAEGGNSFAQAVAAGEAQDTALEVEEAAEAADAT